MRRRKHSKRTGKKTILVRDPLHRKKRLSSIGLILGVLMTLSILTAAYTIRVSDPIGSSKNGGKIAKSAKPAPVAPYRR